MNAKPPKSLAIVLSTAALVASLATTDARAATIQKGAVNELPPGEHTTYAFGDRSVWRNQEQDEITVVVTGVKRGIVSYLVSNGCTFTSFRASFYAQGPRWKNCEGSTGTAKVTRVGKSRLFPLKVGNAAKWKVRGKSSKGNKWSTTRSCKVRGTANVTVPAGNFDTYHVVCTDDWTIRQWYFSPEVGLNVVSIHAPRKGQKGRRTKIELVSYSPVARSGGTTAATSSGN